MLALSFVILMLGKTPNVDKKSFVLVVNEFWGCVGLIFEEYCWFDWFYIMFVKGKCWVFKGNAVKTPVLVLTID